MAEFFSTMLIAKIGYQLWNNEQVTFALYSGGSNIKDQILAMT